MAIKDSDTIQQSKAAYSQWAPQWRERAKFHSKHKMLPMSKFYQTGFGKAILSIANGKSFEDNIEIIKKYQHNVDIICVDKCLKHCLEHGIKPKYVLVCDANVSYETYLQPVETQLEGITLFINVCANTKWSDNGNWKEIIFFVNKDVLGSEKEFIELSGCNNVIAAGTNVSNAQMVLLTQCDNNLIQNFFGYDKILMIGYDYCWSDDGYYAYDKDGGGKSNYMKTVYIFNLAKKFCFTSTNLLFSAKWLDKYISTFKIPAYQCSADSLLAGVKVCNLAEQMRYLYKPEDAGVIIDLVAHRKELKKKMDDITIRINEICTDHNLQVRRTT